MRRFLLIFALLLLSCRTLFPGSLAPTNTPTVGNTPAASLAPTQTFTPTASPVPPTPQPPALPEVESFSVRYHPDGGLFVGDQVSMEVIAPQGENLADQSVEIRVGDQDSEQVLATTGFGGYGIGGRQQATFLWAWDTSGLEAGPYTLTYSILPNGPAWTETVLLQPADQMPPPEPEAHWATTETECCVIYYITGTGAERDLALLERMVDEQAQSVNRLLEIEPKDPVLITFLPRVLGHGGFASDEISVSYLDRNYAGSSPETVLHHELVHWQDASLGGDFRPTMLVEGLAVYLTGGHFKAEPLIPRAAALLSPVDHCGLQTVTLRQVMRDMQHSAFLPAQECGLNWYLPLRDLADNFYTSQHEIGYLQAGALVEYMVDTWGWKAYSDFYRSIPEPENGSQAGVMDTALRHHFDISLEQLESQFLAELSSQQLTTQLVDDVRLTIEFYDTVRRYQRLLDPSAYFLTAWLPDGEEMRSRGIVADFLRRPTAPENVAIETLLVGVDAALRAGDFVEAEKLLGTANDRLDGFEQQAETAWARKSMSLGAFLAAELGEFE